MLRDKIKKAIEAADGDAEKASLKVCVLLEDEIGLAGNGWFDNDEPLEKAISEFYGNT